MKSMLIQQLSFYVKQTSDGNEMIFRCPLHEDRRGHLYVSTENLEYICFKCGIKGRNFIKFLITHNKYLTDSDKLVLTDILSDLVLSSESEIHEQYDNVKNGIDSVNNGTYQKIRLLFHELIDLLNNHAKKNRQVIYRYFADTRRITDKNYIDELINNKYILFYSKELFTTVSSYIESIFNKKMIRIDQAIVLTTPGSGILQFRVLDKNVDNRLRYYTLKLKEINPNANVFYIGNIRNPQICIVVEGIFDAIKLNYLFKEHIDNYIIVALMGKNNVNSITEIRNLLSNVSIYIIALDMDVSVGDIKSVYNVINKVNSKDKNVYVLTKRSNNVTDKDFDNITDFNEFKEKFILVNYTKYVTGVWKLSNLFDVVEEE